MIMDPFTFIGICTFLYVVIHTFLIFLFDCDIRLKIAEKFGKGIEAVQGKVIWVTGASSGIGEHLAIWLAKGGAKVVLSARRQGELERVKQACLAANPKLSPNDVMVLPMDMTKLESHGPSLDAILNYFGKLDILVNNAGRSQRAAWEEVEPVVDRQLFELNVFSVVALSRVVLTYFAQCSPQLDGHIVVTSSLAGLIGAPFSPTYTGAKHALHGYFESLRSEKMGTNLQITLLCPGPVFSNFLSESFTGRDGEKFDQPVQEGDKRMTADRCGQLCAIAIANQLYEGWMALFPVLPIIYFALYYPNLARLVLRMVGGRRLQTLRDSRQTVGQNQ